MAKGRYAAIGYVVSKVVLPVAKRTMKRKARRAVTGSAGNAARAARSNPGKASIAVGSIAGAAAYLARRRSQRRSGDE